MCVRRILVCVTGVSPAVVTETLYALGTQAGWIATDVHLITTPIGAQSARRALLEPGPENQIGRLCADYGWPVPRFGREYLHLIRDGTDHRADVGGIPGSVGSDATADTVLEVLRSLTAIDDSELHFSIAGGRKTMTFYLGYIGAMLARTNDRMSHVLVSPAAESNRNFFYPTPGPCLLEPTNQGQSAIDASAMQVELVEVPFIALRDSLPGNLLTDSMSYSQTLAVINAEPRLDLEIRKRGDGAGYTGIVSVPNAAPFALESQMFAVYWFLSVNDLHVDSPVQAVLDDYVDVYDCLVSHTDKKAGKAESMRQAARRDTRQFVQGMQRVANKIASKLAEHVDSYFLYRHYTPRNVGVRARRHFTMRIDRNRIHRAGQDIIADVVRL